MSKFTTIEPFYAIKNGSDLLRNLIFIKNAIKIALYHNDWIGSAWFKLH